MESSWGNKIWQKTQVFIIPFFVVGVWMMFLYMGKEGNMGMNNRQVREWPALIKIAREKGLTPDQTYLLLAMRDAENGPAGYEFGVKAAKGTDLDEQARWAAGSIKANEARYQKLLTEGQYVGSRRTIPLGQGEPVDFIEFMAYKGSPTGYGWAPIDAPGMADSEVKMNKNWAKNVRSLKGKYKKRISEKGVVLE